MNPEQSPTEPNQIGERVSSRSAERLDYGEIWVKQGQRAVLKGNALIMFEKTSGTVQTDVPELASDCFRS